MKVKLLAAVILVMSVGTAGAIVDISAGPYIGMNIPVVNDQAKSGRLFGLQAKVSFLSFLAVGAHYSSSSLGEVEHTFFEGQTDYEFTESIDGGDITSFGFDAYLGMTGFTPGVKLYFVGSLGTWKWKRDYTDEVSETVFGVGPALEVVLPFNLGLEGRGMFEIAPTDGGGSVKSVVWFVGANYHFGSLLK
jgi:hypothetical protein